MLGVLDKCFRRGEAAFHGQPAGPAAHRVNPIDDEARQRHSVRIQPVDKVGRLPQGGSLGRGDHDK